MPREPLLQLAGGGGGAPTEEYGANIVHRRFDLDQTRENGANSLDEFGREWFWQLAGLHEGLHVGPPPRAEQGDVVVSRGIVEVRQQGLGPCLQRRVQTVVDAS